METKENCPNPTPVVLFLTACLEHKLYVKESFHESVLGGGAAENNNHRFLSLNFSAADREAAEDECEVGTYCNYFTRVSAKPAKSPTSVTVCLSPSPSPFHCCCCCCCCFAIFLHFILCQKHRNIQFGWLRSRTACNNFLETRVYQDSCCQSCKCQNSSNIKLPTFIGEPDSRTRIWAFCRSSGYVGRHRTSSRPQGSRLKLLALIHLYLICRQQIFVR